MFALPTLGRYNHYLRTVYGNPLSGYKDQNLNLLTIRLPLPFINTTRIWRDFIFTDTVTTVGAANTLFARDLIVASIFINPAAEVFIRGVLSAFIYHFFAGIRQLLMDASGR